MNLGFDELKNLVIDRGLCTVCGTCIGICPTASVELSYDHEEPIPRLRGKCNHCGNCNHACPGRDVPLLELEKFFLGKIRKKQSEDFGVFTFSGMGYAIDDKIRRGGASGGFVTALMSYALESGFIDCALVTGFSQAKPWRAQPTLAATPQQVIECAQSKYLPAAVNSLLGAAAKGYEKIGVVGLPCHVEAIRKMQYLGLVPAITRKIKVLIGLFCGANWHFEGTRHVLSELCGVRELNQIVRIQCRGRTSGWRTKFVVELDNGIIRDVPRDTYVLAWLAAFKRDRCLMCIDWSSELADISTGDYWGPEGEHFERPGVNSVLVRTTKGAELLRGAREANLIELREAPASYLRNCAGFEWKKHGAIFCLAQRQRYGWPTPDFHCRLSHDPYVDTYESSTT